MGYILNKEVESMSLREINTELDCIYYLYPNFPKGATNEVMDMYEKLRDYKDCKKYIRVNLDEAYIDLKPIDDEEEEGGKGTERSKLVLSINRRIMRK